MTAVRRGHSRCQPTRGDDVSETPTTPEGEPDQTPSAPDVDQPGGGQGDAERTPSTPDVDQPDGGAED
jgi:hypothetical protein